MDDYSECPLGGLLFHYKVIRKAGVPTTTVPKRSHEV